MKLTWYKIEMNSMNVHYYNYKFLSLSDFKLQKLLVDKL